MGPIPHYSTLVEGVSWLYMPIPWFEWGIWKCSVSGMSIRNWLCWLWGSHVDSSLTCCWCVHPGALWFQHFLMDARGCGMWSQLYFFCWWCASLGTLLGGTSFASLSPIFGDCLGLPVGLLCSFVSWLRDTVYYRRQRGWLMIHLWHSRGGRWCIIGIILVRVCSLEGPWVDAWWGWGDPFDVHLLGSVC